MLAPVVRRLSERDKKVLRLRFFDDCTQQEIAQEIGVTQTQVSRLLSRIFASCATVSRSRKRPADRRHPLG